MTKVMGVFGTTTDWHSCLRVALLMPDTATGCTLGSAGLAGLPPFSTASPPYCTKPVPSSSDAVTTNVDPETENEAAMAPLAIPKITAPTTATAGSITTA